MYGTVATMRVKAGQETKLVEMAERWWKERAPKVNGAMSTTVFKKDAGTNEYVMVAMFDSKVNYEANAADPAQGDWYQEMRACLESDPVWNDGEIVFHGHQH